MSNGKRGYMPTDEKEFNIESQVLLRRAQQDILYLMERGYPIKSASTFVGNHFLLSERQRLAIVRATAANSILELRSQKRLLENLAGKIIAIDGLNVIITLEVALLESTLIQCMDGVVRDLAGLRGTYRLIDETEQAIKLIGDKMESLKIKEVVFYLDAPVSNTGRLKRKIMDLLEGYSYTVSVELVKNPDIILEKLENVITGDAMILNKCESWINLISEIIDEKLPGLSYVKLC